MIEDVKWLKPDDYSKKNRRELRMCFLAVNGSVYKGYFDGETYRLHDGDKLKPSDIEMDIDGVCERNPKQKKPVLR